MRSRLSLARDPNVCPPPSASRFAFWLSPGASRCVAAQRPTGKTAWLPKWSAYRELLPAAERGELPAMRPSMKWLPASVDAFRKTALVRKAGRSNRAFAFYEMAPGVMWAVILNAPKDELHLCELANPQDARERQHVLFMRDAVLTYVRELEETRKRLQKRLQDRIWRQRFRVDEPTYAEKEAAAAAERRREFDEAHEEALAARATEATGLGDAVRDPEESLRLYHEASGVEMVWDMQQHPADDASEAEWARWREVSKGLINEHVAVSPLDQLTIQEAFLKELSPNAPLCACASCGSLMAKSYERFVVNALPEQFRYTERQRAELDAMGSVELCREVSGRHSRVPVGGEGGAEKGGAEEGGAEEGGPEEGGAATLEVETYTVNLRDMVCCFQDGDGPIYHLHADLVDFVARPCEGGEMEVDAVAAEGAGEMEVDVAAAEGAAAEGAVEKVRALAPKLVLAKAKVAVCRWVALLLRLYVHHRLWGAPDNGAGCFPDLRTRQGHAANRLDCAGQEMGNLTAAMDAALAEAEEMGEGAAATAAAAAAAEAEQQKQQQPPQQQQEKVATVRLCNKCAAHARGGQPGPPPQSLAAGIDYGRSDCLKLPPLTDIEKLILSDMRMYANVVKVAAPSMSDKKDWQHVQLRGHFITFVHQGRDAFTSYIGRALSAEQRVSDFLDLVSRAWPKRALPPRAPRAPLAAPCAPQMCPAAVRACDVRLARPRRAPSSERRPQVKVNILGPEGSHDVLLRRLLVSPEMAIRPVVCYNYLQLRQAIMHMARLREAPEKQPAAPTLDEVIAALRRVPDVLRKTARKSSDTSIDERAGNAPSDIAGVREFATSKEGVDSEAFEIAKEIVAEDGATAGFEAPHDEKEHEEHQGHEATPRQRKLVMSHIGVMNAATNSDAILEGTLDAVANLKPEQPQDKSLFVTRDSKPTSEFLGNGTNLMEGFWYEFPLGRGLERFEGTIPAAATKHLMQHYSLRFQRNARLVLLLANQVQRHTVLKSVSGAVREDSKEELIALINRSDFNELAATAAQNPSSREAKEFMKKVMPTVSVVGRGMPWGSLERASCIGKMLAIIRRYGPPSIFLTVAPDDVHSPVGIRLTIQIANGNDAFPAAAGDFLHRLAEEPEAFAEDISGGADADGLEDVLQRNAAQHPASMSMLYHRVARFVMEVVIGTPFVDQDKLTKPMHERRTGMFGRGLASFGVTEQTGRATHHLHLVGWCGAMPSMCSAAGQDAEVFAHLAAELEKQYKSELPLAVHVLDVMRRATYSKLFRGEHREPLDVVVPTADGTSWEVNPEMQRSAHVTAAGKQTHAWDAGEHDATCHKPPNGDTGCRMGSPAVYPIRQSRCIRVRDVQKTEEGRQHVKQTVADLLKKSEREHDRDPSTPRLTRKAAEEQAKDMGLPAVLMERLATGPAAVAMAELTCGEPSVDASFELKACPGCWPRKASILNTGELWLNLTDVPTEKQLAREQATQARAAAAEATAPPDALKAAQERDRERQKLPALVAREAEKGVVIELRRPKLTAAKAIADKVPSKEDLKELPGPAVKSVWEGVQDAMPEEVLQELARPEWAEVREKLQALSEAEVRERTSKEAKMMLKMLDVFRLLPCANSRITCYNEMLTAMLRCNTAPYLLGARESSRAACFCAPVSHAPHTARRTPRAAASF